MTLFDRILGRTAPPAAKATTGGPALVSWQTSTPLSSLGHDWNTRARHYLDAYRVGWFYKAGSRIASDLASLSWELAYEDSEGDNEEDLVAAPGNVPWERLEPLEQLLRLAERPNPWRTGRQLRHQSQVHLDFTGRAMLYLENGEGGGLPTALFGVNPCRMWPSRNPRGELIGWVLDKDKPSGGVPFSADEIVVIESPGTDDDPQGVVEGVYAQVTLSRQVPQHTSDVLATGGRLAGMAWPKERSLNEAEFLDAQRAWRSVTSDPNAARRLLLFPEPMEYQAGAATPSEIGIPELASLTRDEILTAFPIAPEMLMVPMATGLNSGQTQAAVEARYWSGTMHPRVETWEDAIQQQLIPRYEAAVGRPLDFDIEEPNLDGATEIVEKVGALRGLIALGFDPKDSVGKVGLDHIKWNGLPEPTEPVGDGSNAAGEEGPSVAARDTSPKDSATVQQVVAKADKARDIMAETLPEAMPLLTAFLDAQRQRVIDGIERVYAPLTKAARKALPDDWWDVAAEDAALTETVRGLYVDLSRTALGVVSNQLERVVLPTTIKRVTEFVLEASGARITGINETTRAAITEQLAIGVQRGYTLGQMLDGYAAEGFKGIRNIGVWEDWRAERIARTETMRAYNDAALTGYREYNVAEVVASDGIGDDDCAARAGRTFPLAEAMSIEDHPNGTLDWIPVN